MANQLTKLDILRQKYPEYDHLDNQELADRFHEKYYAHIPKDQYYSKLGFTPQATQATQETQAQEEPTSVLEDTATSIAGAIPEIASMAMNLPKEAYGAVTHPIQTLKNIPIGLAEGAAGAFNLPGNLARYAAKKGYLPEALAKLTPHIPIEQIEEKLGLLPEKPGEALTRGISGFGALGKIGKFGEASALKRATLGGGYAAGQEQNPATGALLGLIPNAIEGGQKAYRYLREPKRALSESQASLQAIKDALSQQKNLGESEQVGMTRFLNQIQEGLTNRNEHLESRLPEIFPIRPESATRLNLNVATHDAIQKLDQEFTQRYGEFENQYGQTQVNEPFNWHEINLDRLPHTTLTTRQMGHRASNDILDYTNSEGQEISINFPADNSTVQDYVNFSRELRDAAWDASKAAKRATYGEAIGLRRTSNRLRQLQAQAEEKIHSTIGDEPFNQYRGIQQDYARLMGPVKTEPSLFNAVYKNKISNKIHDVLLQPANEHIRNYLYEHPEFTTALREHLMQGSKHPLRAGQPFNPASVNEDIQYLLTPEQRAAQAERAQYHHAQNRLNDISKYIKNDETLTPQQTQQVREFHPEASRYITNAAQRRSSIRQLERQKAEQETEKERHSKRLTKQRTIIGAGTALALSTQGHKITDFIRKLF